PHFIAAIMLAQKSLDLAEEIAPLFHLFASSPDQLADQHVTVLAKLYADERVRTFAIPGEADLHSLGRNLIEQLVDGFFRALGNFWKKWQPMLFPKTQLLVRRWDRHEMHHLPRGSSQPLVTR